MHSGIIGSDSSGRNFHTDISQSYRLAHDVKRCGSDKLMVAVALSCGATSADADELVFTWRWCADNGTIIEITEKDYKIVDDVGVYDGPYKDAVMADDEDGNHGLIHQGRFYWPCF